MTNKRQQLGGVRILHLIDSGGLYGAERMVLNLMREQRVVGLAPTLGSIGALGILDKEIEVEARKAEIEVRVFRMRNGLNMAGGSSIPAS